MGGTEVYGIGAVALAVIAILSFFVRSLVKRQDAMFVWFTEKLNGSLEALKVSIESQKHATEHNTRNLKTVQTLSTDILKSMRETFMEQESKNTDLIMAKLEELLERDRSRTRESEPDSPQL